MSDSTASLPDGLAALLGDYLLAQRWYAGSKSTGVPEAVVIDGRRLVSNDDGRHHLHWAIVEVDSARYQLLIGERPNGEEANFLAGHDGAYIGCPGGSYFYDAVFDSELMLALHQLVVGTQALRVRPVGAEQSNTSLVFDDKVIVKIYRRLMDGANPDIEVTSALSEAGFDHVAAPAGTWSSNGVDLAFAQRFLAGGSEGWALALTSLRDLFASSSDDPGEAGGDFSGEARRLGQVSAKMHVALARAFGLEPVALGAGWAGFVDDLVRRLEEAVGDDPARASAVVEFAAAARSVDDPGVAVRVHGDYHLGQVMRTDAGWFVLDFEGEPARPVHERIRPSSVMKDVTGMVRSFDYAARFVQREWGEDDVSQISLRADAWEHHNRNAFLEGYLSATSVEELLAPSGARAVVMAAFELDKALYELGYETAYRPGWVEIPRAAIGRILDRLA